MDRSTQNFQLIPGPHTSLSIHLLRILIKFMAKSGIDLQHCLEAEKIDPLVLKDAKARISSHQFYKIWQTAVCSKDDPNIGLRFGREIGDHYFKKSMLFSMMSGAGTVKKALELFCRYHDLSEDVILPKIKTEKDLTFLSWEPASPDVHFPRQISEAMLCAYARILHNISDGALNPLEIRFHHGQPPDIQEHQDIFMAPLRFHQLKNEIVIHKNDLDLPVFFLDPDLVETLKNLAEKQLDQLYDSDSWAFRVRELICKRLSHGNETGIHTISSILAVSPRKLQNRLKIENMTFQQILDQTRKGIATRLLSQKKIPICDIAQLLGFSEQSAFNHAFRRWTGLSPGQFRKAL